MSKWMKVYSPPDGNGERELLGDTPITDDFELCDGSYGLYDYCDERLPRKISPLFRETVEEELINQLRCNATANFMGFTAYIYEEEDQ